MAFRLGMMTQADEVFRSRFQVRDSPAVRFSFWFLRIHQSQWLAEDDYDDLYTLWLFNIAMENGPFIDGLPIINGDFSWLC